jgi:hypothetical protein
MFTPDERERLRDELVALERSIAAKCIPCSIEPPELKRAFQETTDALVGEIRQVNGELKNKLTEVLQEIGRREG